MKWVDVNDELPTHSGDFLVTTKNGYVQIAKFWRGLKENQWSGQFTNCVIAWMEVPEPYIKEENE